jgi:hypothetical protein
VLSLSIGPPAKVPEDEPHCEYGPWGRFGTAWRGIWPIVRDEAWGAILMTLTIAAVTGVAFSVRDTDPTMAKVWTVLFGVAAGIAVGAALVYLWGLRPWGWRRHWRMTTSTENHDPGHATMWVKSRHWHTTLNIRCLVRDDEGTWHTAPAAGQFGPRVIFKPGATALGVAYPEDFDAPPAEPGGRYAVKWRMDVEGGDKPVTLARGHFRTAA